MIKSFFYFIRLIFLQKNLIISMAKREVATQYVGSLLGFIWTRPLQNGTLCPISASGSNFNPRNIQYIPPVEIFAFLELEHKLPFFKGLGRYQPYGHDICILGCIQRGIQGST